MPPLATVSAVEFCVGCSVGKTAAGSSVLEIKEFVPGRPWGSRQANADATVLPASVGAVSIATATSAANAGSAQVWLSSLILLSWL